MSYYSRRSFMGAMHPVLFFLVVCVITLFMAFFIGNALYAHLNPGSGSMLVAQGRAATDIAHASLPVSSH
ncbi:hypothetical protein SAMN05444008_108176 [Cnuella takakiae]|uniref:Uncharacterized protein n=1 Tax=Cnuella takakiae TaxID=1302690 RepID=A0A1M5C096_9BACT|nr:hypothetical protein [Cnuella takakiae]SHF48173.1 hypothetical protein SAMN05444008_108176 [Cnuella takakiae]